MSETLACTKSTATNLSVAIAEEIAERENTDPIDLTPPLHSVIDTEALASLFHSSSMSSADREGAVQFTYCGYTVTVDSDGQITITE